MRDLRGGVHEVLQWRKDGKEPFWNELVIAVTHIIHKINICEVDSNGCNRGSISK